MVKCPHCNKPAMTLLRKSALGPGRAVPCQSCRRPVAAHRMGVFAAVPAFLGGFALMKNGFEPLGVLAVVGGLLAMALLQTFAVPLVRA